MLCYFKRSILQEASKLVWFLFTNLFTAYSSLSSVSSSLSSPAISPRNISPVNPTDANTNLGKSNVLRSQRSSYC